MTQSGPSDRELDVLKVLWKLGEARVRDVHEAMCAQGQCAFTTVQTLLRIMAEKKWVSQRSRGRTLYYTAKYSPGRAASRFLHKVFDGSLDQLVLNMLDAEDVSTEELKQLERVIVRQRRKKQSRGGS